MVVRVVISDVSVVAEFVANFVDNVSVVDSSCCTVVVAGTEDIPLVVCVVSGAALSVTEYVIQVRIYLMKHFFLSRSFSVTKQLP